MPMQSCHAYCLQWEFDQSRVLNFHPREYLKTGSERVHARVRSYSLRTKYIATSPGATHQFQAAEDDQIRLSAVCFGGGHSCNDSVDSVSPNLLQQRIWTVSWGTKEVLLWKISQHQSSPELCDMRLWHTRLRSSRVVLGKSGRG